MRGHVTRRLAISHLMFVDMVGRHLELMTSSGASVMGRGGPAITSPANQEAGLHSGEQHATPFDSYCIYYYTATLYYLL